jgi:hypothetical protein
MAPAVSTLTDRNRETSMTNPAEVDQPPYECPPARSANGKPGVAAARRTHAATSSAFAQRAMAAGRADESKRGL